MPFKGLALHRLLPIMSPPAILLERRGHPRTWAGPHPKSDGVPRDWLKHTGLWLERVLHLVTVNIA